MINFRDNCDCTGKQVDLETRQGEKWTVSLVGLPDGQSQILRVKANRPSAPDYVITLPIDVIEAIHDITSA